jgi:hypothetical protein
MKKLQPQRSSIALKTIVGLILSLTLAGAFAVGSQARSANSSPRSGALHVTKVCGPPDFDGQPGSFCTIQSSNLKGIGAGSKVFYAEANVPGAAVYDTDLYLYTGPGNSALGHVTLSTGTGSGVLTLSGGSGRFRGFHARVRVTFDAGENLWHWDGTYHFRRR